MTISHKLIGIFIFCKKEPVVHILRFQIKDIYNFCQKRKLLEPPIILLYIFHVMYILEQMEFCYIIALLVGFGMYIIYHLIS